MSIEYSSPVDDCVRQAAEEHYARSAELEAARIRQIAERATNAASWIVAGIVVMLAGVIFRSTMLLVLPELQPHYVEICSVAAIASGILVTAFGLLRLINALGLVLSKFLIQSTVTRESPCCHE